ncbi:hypothetical protein [Roseovarius rhodophyticola]|uniref:VCBS repeat-containing protein n=1 Tax=Roseovarius rhodophyticola TaxID=3080827 RepID=A0ABZ2TPV4_9RHOB
MTTALPPTEFDYEGVKTPSWQTNSTVDFPEHLEDRDNGTRFGDLNGDGLTDIIRYEKKNDDGFYTIDTRRVHINKGDGTWDIDVAWGWDDIDVPFFYHQESGSNHIRVDMGSRLIDVNGDGLDDFVSTFQCNKRFFLATIVKVGVMSSHLALSRTLTQQCTSTLGLVSSKTHLGLVSNHSRSGTLTKIDFATWAPLLLT